MKQNVLDVLRAAGDSLTYAADVLEAPANAYMRELARDMGEAWDTVSALVGALKGAEGFVSGFEDDGMQEGVTDMLAAIRAAIARAKGIV